MPTCGSDVKENTRSCFLKKTEPTVLACALTPATLIILDVINLSKYCQASGEKQSGFVSSTSMVPAEIFSCYFIVAPMKSYSHHLSRDNTFFFHISFYDPEGHKPCILLI